MESKLNYSVLLSVRAEKDLETSFTWYEGQQKGLGSRFIEEVMHRIRKIEQNHELFSIKYKSYGETSVARFPFIILYRINKRKNIIRIVSVFHAAQNPKKKYGQ